MSTLPELEEVQEDFNMGIICAQQVLAHFADRLGLTEEIALRIASAFGSGMDIARKNRTGRDGRDPRAGRGRPDDRRNESFDAPRRPSSRGQVRGKEHNGRWFSCLDLSLDVLAKTLLNIPHLVSWKIEGRKKGPHYVYHVVTAYRMLRDNPGDAQARKAAEEILQMSLGRPSTRARFLPQKDHTIPTTPDGQTSSGLLAGKIRIEPEGGVTLKPFFELLPQDYLRVGVEDERWHG